VLVGVLVAERTQAEAAMPIIEALTQAVLCGLVVGQERRFGFARHVPQNVTCSGIAISKKQCSDICDLCDCR
jgi:hypothetical protein